ncbi:MAG: hypothetical protein ACOH5I_01495 [Oligoflexus sp.]
MAHSWFPAKILFGALCFIYSLPAMAMERMQLQPGEVQAIVIDERITWHLSRRGIVELTQDQDGIWNVVALRAGLVVARAKTASGREVQQYIIQVAKKTGKNGGLLQREPWGEWVCQMPGLICDHNMQRIQGELFDPKLFYQISSLCEKYQPCVFDLKLAASARQRFQEELLYHPGLFDMHIHTAGTIQLRIDCEFWSKTNWQDFIKNTAVPLSFWQWTCLDGQEMYRLEVRAYMVDQHSFQKIQPQALVNDLSWQTFLQKHGDFIKDHALNEVIGEPMVLVSIGKPVEIHHGMEIPVISSAADAQEYWRKIGFVLKAKIKARRENRLQTDIEFALSQPGRDRQLTSSHLHTSVWLSLGVEQVIGTLDSTSILSQQQEHFFLAAVPIIGPLFRSKQKSHGQARVVLLMKLQKTDRNICHIDGLFCR